MRLRPKFWAHKKAERFKELPDEPEIWVDADHAAPTRRLFDTDLLAACAAANGVFDVGRSSEIPLAACTAANKHVCSRILFADLLSPSRVRGGQPIQSG